MSTEEVIALVVCLAAAAGSAGIGAVARAKLGRSAPLVIGIGLALAFVGAWMSGLAVLAWHGVLAIVDWLVAIPTELLSIIGASLLGVGIVVWVIGGVLGRRAKDRTPATGSSPTTPPKPSIAPAGRGVARPSGMAKPPQAVDSPKDAERSTLDISEPLEGRGSSKPTASGNLPPTLP